MTNANVCISEILRQRQVTEDLENIIMASKLNHHWKYLILLHGFKYFNLSLVFSYTFIFVMDGNTKNIEI
jgi:hypothetical protein